MQGKVWLVGAGPGDPELLTVKAMKVIAQAQAVVYDRLVSEAIMQLVPPTATLHFVGKSCKRKAMTQEDIQALLVTLAQQGLRVVRLKGGDPLFFGRGGEEALELVKYHIPFEIIPGITSAQGCGAYAGIPLTHRGLATGVRFLTGHRTAEEDTESTLKLNWLSLADPDTTLVIYMGLANLGIIATKLIEHGLPPEFAAAAISHGTTINQRVILSDLAHIAAEVAQAQLESPVLAIIGKVAALAATLSWFQQATDSSLQPAHIFTNMSQ